jgi:signal transduction histidine kinase
MHLSFCHFIIAEQHQGQIAVTCNENDGTTFHIQLPTK